MPMQVVSTGLKVAQSAPLALPATAAGTIFTITGSVWIQGIFLRVTTVVQSQATTIQWAVKMDALTSVTISNATADLNAAAVGTIFMPVTTLATTAVNNANGVLIGVPITAPPISVICAGVTGIITLTTGATSTGACQHSVLYAPMSPGAVIQ